MNVPYFIIQPRLANVKEYKVCILTNSFTGEEGKPFLCINPHPKGKAFINPFDHTRLYEFVQRAKSLYEEKVSTLVSPILRIDIMITQFGKLVVNEFESLEAYIHAGVRGSTHHEGAARCARVLSGRGQGADFCCSAQRASPSCEQHPAPWLQAQPPLARWTCCPLCHEVLLNTGV